MTFAARKLSIEDYARHEDGSDRRYELVNGDLVPMPPESRLNSRIALFLVVEFSKFLPLELLCCGDTAIETGGRLASARLPDVMVLTPELVSLLGDERGTILRDMPPPQLVVEVVSPGKANADRDYRYKRSEYAARGIAEYWIVDPQRGAIAILTWVEGLYEERVFAGEEPLISATFPQLELTAARAISAGGPTSE